MYEHFLTDARAFRLRPFLAAERTILFMYFEEQLKYDLEKGFGTEGLAYPIKLMGGQKPPINSGVEMSGYDPESEIHMLKTSTSVVGS